MAAEQCPIVNMKLEILNCINAMSAITVSS